MIACPSCGFESPDDFAFCGGCGAALAAPPPLPEERKPVTTLFCDLVAFTAMSEAADPEDIAALLSEYFTRTTNVIESHGGTVEKFIGDAVVGVFGVPAVHEDDPERAVRAALRILEALEGMSRPDGSPLEARCGVNTGEVLVRLDIDPASGRGFLAGDAVNVAARLEAAAPPGGVAVGALTHALTERVIVYEELPAVTAKGKSEPVEAWLAKARLARTGLRTSGASATPFVGRRRELAVLVDELDEAKAQRRGRIVLLVGEPGIGKSRLMLEFARLLDERPEWVNWRQGRCLPYGEGITFWALGEVLKEHAGILDSDAERTVEAKLEAILADGDDKPWLRQRLRPLLGLDSTQADRSENFEAWARFLERIASARPAVVVLEDLHWAGEAMLGFVDHLLVRGLEGPLLLVATTRPELLSQHDGPLALARADRFRRLHLRGLTKRHAEVLVKALLGTGSSQDARRAVAHAAGGNPLYAEQVARLLGDRSSAEGGDQHAGRHTSVPEEAPLPDSLKGVLAARMDTLPPVARTFLSYAAVLGETFWRGGLIALSGAEASDVDAGLAVLLARDFVRPLRTSSIAHDREYLFWHALSRDAAYAQLPRKVRASKHRAAAVWLEESARSSDDELSEIVAHHYTAALEFARASRDAELADALARPAIDALTRAVDRALRLDVLAAERYLAQALELAGDDAPARLALLPRRAKLLLLTDRYHDAAEAFDQAVIALLDAGEVRQAALALSWQSDALATLGEPTMALQPRALELLAGDGPSAELAEILSRYALALIIHDDDPRLVIATADRAIRMASSLGLPEPALALSTRGGARLDLGDLAGEEDLRRAERAAQEQGLGIERSTILLNHTGTAFMTRGAAAERDAVMSGYEFVSRHGLTAYADNFRSALIHSAYKMGEWDECLASIADALPRVMSVDDQWDVLFLRSLLTMIAAARGRAAETEEHLVWLVEQGAPCEVGWARSYALVAAAMGRVSLDDRVAARTVLEAWLDKPQGVRTVLDAVPQAIRTAREVDEELAYAIAGEFEREMPAVLYPLTKLVHETERALLAELRHDYEAAAAGFADAAAGWQAFAMPFEQAHALYGQGRCLSALGGEQEAVGPLAAARETFVRLDVRPTLREMNGLLRRAD